MSYIQFTYDRLTANALPLKTVKSKRCDQVAIECCPDINGLVQQKEKGCALNAELGLDFNRYNIREIRVESRKAYEILNNIIKKHRDIFIRINPPLPIAKNKAELDIITIVTTGTMIENNLALEIIDKLHDAHEFSLSTAFFSPEITKSKMVVYCNRSGWSLDHLAVAVGSGCKIVSSDAGAAEEYLARFAEPRQWHIAKSFQSDEWCEKIKDLLGEENSIKQTSLVDQSPYMKKGVKHA